MPRPGMVKSRQAACFSESEKYFRARSQSPSTIKLIAACCAPIRA
ncbi:MAG TPA: hypothetical protein VKC65_00395 [Gaiellaceae bacterium]|nr:hypothetical protein [Gaiellaceae bacterium]